MFHLEEAQAAVRRATELNNGPPHMVIAAGYERVLASLGPPLGGWPFETMKIYPDGKIFVVPGAHRRPELLPDGPLVPVGMEMNSGESTQTQVSEQTRLRLPHGYTLAEDQFNNPNFHAHTGPHAEFLRQASGGAASYTYEQGPRTSNVPMMIADPGMTVHPGWPQNLTRRGGRGDVPVEPNDGTMQLGPVSDVRVGERPYYAHTLRDISGGSGASSGFTAGGGDAPGVQLNDYILAALRGHGGCQAVFADQAGGRFVAIRIDPPQQGNQGVVAAASGTEDGPDDLAQRALQSVFASLEPLCFTLLLDDNILKGGSPGYIKAATCVGLGLVTGLTYLGLASKKRAKAAVRVVASTCMSAVSIALVYNVSEDVYVKCTCGIIGAVATLATMAIDW